MDFMVSLLMIIVFLPVMIICYLIVVTFMDRKAVFTQKRPGKHGKPFTIFKFKTMTDARDEHGTLLPDSQRLTKLGKLMRATSLDELPQLFNVLKGDMSFVGPRPLLMEYLPLYNELQARRHEVRPGITGWAQINGRNAINWPSKFALDIYYVDHQSFFLDLKIIWLTIRKVLISDGITDGKTETATRFTGNT